MSRWENRAVARLARSLAKLCYINFDMGCPVLNIGAGASAPGMEDVVANLKYRVTHQVCGGVG